MLRGAAAAWLGLIALQALTTKNGAGAVGGLLGSVNGLAQRALDPSVPAIPDHSRGGSGTTDKSGNFHPSIPGWLGGGTTPSPGSTDNGGRNNDGFRLFDPPPPGQHNPAYDNPNPGHPGGIPEAYIPWPSVPRNYTT